ncbi:DsbA family protein [Croceicoccus sp. F390]|uniref:DsbA family protein n=1 Tax=Croceicoccus esteveae TaxID=3075597 RepID=A0ABU2ZGT7_9SPHN|nr:DsbA family protein [Croceicoccus sp. F390]MDT0575421.1 DsbA family protein [Croceicoccus sp. F390]
MNPVKSRNHRFLSRPGVLALGFVIAAAMGAMVAWLVLDRQAVDDGLVADNDAAIAAGNFSETEQAAIAALVRRTLLQNPEILPQVAEQLRIRDTGEQLAAIGPELQTPFTGAVLGNPKGGTTLVSFTDYACGFCRKSAADVVALIAADPDLKVVIRELPILSQDSVEAARMALAAAAQGRYAAFHNALFALGQPTAANVTAAARTAGLDLERARAMADDPAIAAEIERNRRAAAQLQIQGTPAWIANGKLLQGAVGKAALAQALDQRG